MGAIGLENCITLLTERTVLGEEIMASRVEVECTKLPRSIKVVFLVFRRRSYPCLTERLHLGYLCSLPWGMF